MSRMAKWVLAIGLASIGVFATSARAQEPQKLADNVYFLVTGQGCNTGWVVFEDYVLVIDANFPWNAEEVLAAIRRTTDKPIRFVFDTHWHGDHAFGNIIYAQEGATVVAHERCLLELMEKGPDAYRRQVLSRAAMRDKKLKNPSLLFPDTLIFDDGERRVELLFNGHAHTSGDAVAYLPKEKILFTGDACVNGAFNYTGDADTENWIRVLDALKAMDVETIAPGHGPSADASLLDKQQRYFVELREQVADGIAASRTVEQIQAAIRIPWYEEWTGVKANDREENIRHVYDELTGRITPLILTRPRDGRLANPAMPSYIGTIAGSSPTRESPGWTKPKKVLIRGNESQRTFYQPAAPDVELVFVGSSTAALEHVADADGMIGLYSPELIEKGKKLRWLQWGAAGIDTLVANPDFRYSDVVLTNMQRIYAPHIGDHVAAMLLAFTRGIRAQLPHQSTGEWQRRKDPEELRGKSALLIGLGGIGTEVARRLRGFDMRIMATDPKVEQKPDTVWRLGKPDKFHEWLPEADVLVVCAPLTSETRGMVGAREFAMMKPTAYLINVARGPLVVTDDLVAALRNGQIAGAGLDVTDPEPLPSDHPLWKMDNVIITPHTAGQSLARPERIGRIWRENLRRFVAGEPLLSVVDKQRGY